MSLPKAFIEMMQPRLGESWSLFRDAVLDGPVYRGVRLHRFTAQADTQTSSDLTPHWALQAPFVPVSRNILPELQDSVPWAEDGFYIATESSLGKTVYHEAGAFYIQEPSAMAVAAALQVQPGERVLDLCAAPGGKTTALGKQMRGQGTLVANEIHPIRVVTLAQNLERTGVPATILNENPQRLADALPGFFDAVLVDAPCSGEGMFRKDHSARSEWQPESPGICTYRQKEILQCAVHMARNGGRIVYSTCTFNPFENEGIVQWALDHLPVTLQPLPEWPGWESGRADWVHDDQRVLGTRRLWPHRARGEGHFVAAFVVDRGESPAQTTSPSRRSASASAPHGWLEWLETLVVPPVADIWTAPRVQGEHLFSNLLEDIHSLKLRVLRPGPCLGIQHQRRFDPHHSFAMTVASEKVRESLEISEAEAARYLNGQVLGNERDIRGYVHVRCEGLPLGWGKGVPGRINNLLPKGLRKTDLALLSH